MAQDTQAPSRTFEWYKMMTDMAMFEVEHGRIRFYETAKMHGTILGGALALASVGIKLPPAAGLGIVVLVLGFSLVRGWLTQINESMKVERIWDCAAAELEKTEEFRNAVGARTVKLWSHESLEDIIRPYAPPQSVSLGMYIEHVRRLRVLYGFLIAVEVIWLVARLNGYAPDWAK